jgi:hypothetical protein
MIFSYKTFKKLYTHYQIFFRFETITNTIPYYTHIQPLGCLGAVNSWDFRLVRSAKLDLGALGAWGLRDCLSCFWVGTAYSCQTLFFLNDIVWYCCCILNIYIRCHGWLHWSDMIHTAMRTNYIIGTWSSILRCPSSVLENSVVKICRSRLYSII